MQPIRSEKAEAELAFWGSRLRQQGVLSNDHFEYFYTAHFGLDRAFYRDQAVLDIGCGPRGSLEWAARAGMCIGLDPLAEAYALLGTGRHVMHYVASGAELLPFRDSAFDVVCSFNSLDHVEALDQVVAEIGRVVSPGGLFLLLTDIHRHPTVLEPMAYSWDVLAKFLPELEVVEQGHFEYSVMSAEGYGDIYQSLRRGVAFNHADPTERYGILSAKLRKRAA